MIPTMQFIDENHDDDDGYDDDDDDHDDADDGHDDGDDPEVQIGLGGYWRL